MASTYDTKARFRLWGEDIRGALMFLTRLPVGGPPPMMPRAFRAFPVAGAAIGFFGAVVLVAALKLGFSPLAGAFAALIGVAAVTGALHEDGLADAADGFGGGANAEEKLRIMADSRLGTYGAVALVLVLGLKAVVLADLAGTFSPLALIFALGAAGAAGRMAPVVLLMVLPAARPAGLGVSAGRPDTNVLSGAIGALLVMVLPALATISVVANVTAGLMAAVAVAGLCRLSRRQIGGQTGDVAGTAVILAETGFLAGLSAA
ncbi:Cobalamin synthase [hydrothermal vent metagenome]|uniref:Adenosylcobinamide-GDP ribazoletransferase n=1 Tax=hydrothermal vent metagenome TaxID=652676 RepID=A0A3B0TP02_9ZZZZ